MAHINIDEVDRITRSFSPRELRRINAVGDVLLRALRSSEQAFEASGSPIPDGPKLSTVLVAVITPARLRAHLADLERLGQFWQQQWREATGKRARIFRRAADDLTNAVALAEAWLREIEPTVAEQKALLDQFENLVKQLQREETMTNELKLQAELTMRQLQSAPGADQNAIARAFEPLLTAIGKAQKQTRRYETKEAQS